MIGFTSEGYFISFVAVPQGPGISSLLASVQAVINISREYMMYLINYYICKEFVRKFSLLLFI